MSAAPSPSVNIGDDDPITLAEACALLGHAWPVPTLRRHAADGFLQTMKIGRVVFTTKADIRRMQEKVASPFLGVEGNIYFVGYGTYVKIGYTRSEVSARVRSLNTGSPEPIAVFAVIRGTPEDERALHKRFASGRLRGEWFRREGALAEFIAELVRG